MCRTEMLQGMRLTRFEEVYGRSYCGELSQLAASEILGVSERTFRRWRDRNEAEGAGGVEAVAGTEKRLQQIIIRPEAAAESGCDPWHSAVSLVLRVWSRTLFSVKDPNCLVDGTSRDTRSRLEVRGGWPVARGAGQPHPGRVDREVAISA